MKTNCINIIEIFPTKGLNKLQKSRVAMFAILRQHLCSVFMNILFVASFFASRDATFKQLLQAAANCQGAGPNCPDLPLNCSLAMMKIASFQATGLFCFVIPRSGTCPLKTSNFLELMNCIFEAMIGFWATSRAKKCNALINLEMHVRLNQKNFFKLVSELSHFFHVAKKSFPSTVTTSRWFHNFAPSSPVPVSSVKTSIMRVWETVTCFHTRACACAVWAETQRMWRRNRVLAQYCRCFDGKVPAFTSRWGDWRRAALGCRWINS